MDVFDLMRIFWAAAASAAAAAAVVLTFRARGLFSWHRSLKAELDELEHRTADSNDEGAEAAGLVAGRCRAILDERSPDFVQLQDLPQYIRSIAACFYPQTDRPELQVTIGACIRGLNRSLDRFDRILNRPGFGRIRRLNLRQIRNLRGWYRQTAQSPRCGWPTFPIASAPSCW